MSFSPAQQEAIRAIVVQQVKNAKAAADREALEDKTKMQEEIAQLRGECVALRAEIKTLRNEISTKAAATPSQPSGQLVTRADMRGILSATLKESSALIERNAAQLAIAEVEKNIVPQMNAMRRAIDMTMTQVKYQNDDTTVELNNYRMAAMLESETNGKRAITDGKTDTRHVIMPGAVRLGFAEDDIT